MGGGAGSGAAANLGGGSGAGSAASSLSGVHSALSRWAEEARVLDGDSVHDCLTGTCVYDLYHFNDIIYAYILGFVIYLSISPSLFIWSDT